MVAGEALEAEATGIEAMGQRAEKEAAKRAATQGLGSDGTEDKAGQKRKFVPASSGANKVAATETGRKAVQEEIIIDDEGA